MDSNYSIFRGKCNEACEALKAVLPQLRLVRGHYNGEPHWWLETPSGDIVDPTALQFDCPNVKDFYEEFNGVFDCAECGKHIDDEKDGIYHGNYVCCSNRCMMRLVGL